MQRLVIPLILALATSVRTVRESSVPGFSAASEAQIKQALENNYDDTGPGAKGQEYAYNTYKTLEEALVSYIDDPDTKLPASERMKAINRLINTPKDYERYTSQPIREYPKSVADYTGYRQIPQIPPIILKKNTLRPQMLYHNPSTNMGVYNLGVTSNVNSVTPKHTAHQLYKLENVHIPGPVTPIIPGFLPYLAANHHEHYDAHAQYSTQGIYDKFTKDNSAFESTGSPVRGYYSFIDASGNQRTIHYSDSGVPVTRRHTDKQ